VTGIAEVQQLQVWRQKLKRWLLESNSPPVNGVQIEIIAHPAEDRGFVVCYIPESKNKPHRAEFPTNKPYLHRVDDNNKVINPSLLQSLFYPKASPQFRLRASIRQIGSTRSAMITVELANTGKATASDICGIFVAGIQLPWQAHTQGVAVHTDDSGFKVFSRIDIHPGMPLRMAFVTTETWAVRLHAIIYAKDAAPQAGVIELDGNHGLLDSEVDLAPQ
jgi:hypothetical protein